MAHPKRLRLSIWVELFFDAALLLLFMVQAFLLGCLLIYGYLPIPTNWGNQLIAERLPPELIFEVDEFRLQPTGHIDLIGLELRATHIQQALLHAQAAEIELKWNGIRKLPSPESLVLSNGTLLIPSIYSPDGHHRPILERIAFRLNHLDEHWEVDRFAALHDSIRLRGSFDLPQRKEEHASIAVDQWIHKFYNQAAKLLQQKERIQYFKTPTIAFKMESSDGQKQRLDLRVSTRSLQHPDVEAERVQLHSCLEIADGQITPLTAPRLTATHLEAPRFRTEATGLSAEIAPQDVKHILQGHWPDLLLAAQSIHVHDFTLDAPILTIMPSAYPKVSLNGATRSLNSAIALDGHVNVEDWSASVRAQGSVDLLSIAPENIKAKLPPIAFESAPYYDLNLQFGKGFSLERADVHAQVDKLQIEKLHFDYINAHASYQDGLITIEDMYLRRQKQWLDLKFSLDSNNFDYRVTLYGSAVPYDYNAILPAWWAGIFRDFDFSQVSYSLGDFIIYGNAKRKASDLYFGHAEARNVRFMDVEVDAGELIVRGRGPYCELHDLNAISGQGWARGNIAFTSKLDDVKGPASIRLDMEAKLALDDAAKLFEGNVASIIDEFNTDHLPLTQLKGAIFHKAYPEYAGKSFFDVSADCPAPIRFKGVPLDYLSFDLYGRSELTHLRNVKFGYADGKGSARIDVLTPSEQASSVRYQLELTDADQNQALQDLPHLDGLEDTLEDTEGPQAPRQEREAARADLKLHGAGPVDAPLKHAGFGHFEIRNEKLGTIQLLGPLSKILQNTQFNFTSFNLQQMKSEFTYSNDIVDFSTLRIDGPRTQIRAPGTMRLSDQALDMRVSVSLFGNAGKPDSNLRKISELITKPIPNLLEFELTGTLKKQTLRSLYDPRNFIPRF